MPRPSRPLRALAATCAVAGLLAACGPRHGAPARPALVVFAAASLRDVALDLGSELERRRPVAVVFNFAGSNTLAQQIRSAPRADVFLSADGEWVDFLEEAGRTVAGSRRPFLSNRLVVVARDDADCRLSSPRDLLTADYRFLALADPRGVPAGRYARAYLEGGDLWAAVSGRVVPALDVRAALALVESDPEILGIVYKTDAVSSPRVSVLYEFPPLEGHPVTYWAAGIEGGESPEAARAFLDFLSSPEARAIAERHGFAPAEG